MKNGFKMQKQVKQVLKQFLQIIQRSKLASKNMNQTVNPAQKKEFAVIILKCLVECNPLADKIFKVNETNKQTEIMNPCEK